MICNMQVSDKSLGLPEVLRNTPPKFTRSDFHGYVFPVLAALASYHSQLEPSLQQRLIKCLEFGKWFDLRLQNTFKQICIG